MPPDNNSHLCRIHRGFPLPSLPLFRDWTDQSDSSVSSMHPQPHPLHQIRILPAETGESTEKILSCPALFLLSHSLSFPRLSYIHPSQKPAASLLPGSGLLYQQTQCLFVILHIHHLMIAAKFTIQRPGYRITGYELHSLTAELIKIFIIL